LRKKVVFLRSCSVDPDVRVEREAKAVSKICDVMIFAWDREGTSKKLEEREYAKIVRFKMKAPYRKLSLVPKLFAWWIFLGAKLLTEKYDIIHACDLDTFLPVVFIAKIRRKKIIYDIFDFYAETIGLSPLITKPIAFIDRKLMSFADVVIIADDLRREQIKPAKIKKLVVIYNSILLDPVFLEDILKIKSENNYFFYAGFLGEERMIKEIFALFKKRKDWTLEICGYGPLFEWTKEQSSKNENIIFLGKIPQEEVIRRMAKVKVCFAFYDPRISNNRYASPNKLFEAIMFQKPIITNRETTMANFVEENKLGRVIDFQDVISLEREFEDYQSGKDGVEYPKDLYAKVYGWELMEKRIINLYRLLAS
jgi:glycosyltransferase involved in cell wall biosynthesis